jgi:acyl-CoA synthetase (AMP-forming)/AMP-acid ligase II
MAAGYSTVAVIPFRYGGAVSLIPRFDPVAMAKNIQNHKITIMSALPTAYRKMLVDIRITISHPCVSAPAGERRSPARPISIGKRSLGSRSTRGWGPRR